MSDTVKMPLSELERKLNAIHNQFRVYGGTLSQADIAMNMRLGLTRLMEELASTRPLTAEQKLDAIREANENPKLSMFELQSQIRTILGDKADE